MEITTTKTIIEKQVDRLYFLDWVRVITILVVFLFHCTRFFDNDDWHVKSKDLSVFADVVISILAHWIMPLFFFISGASTWFALQNKPAPIFIRDRVKRILIPLTFGCLTLALPQVYLERVSHQQFSGTLLQFMPHYFDGWYGFGGNFAWMGLHLWYLLLLFVFSILTLPFFIWYKNYRKSHHVKFKIPLALVFFILITTIPGVLLHPESLPGLKVWGGWNMFEHLLIFAFGYFAYSVVGFSDYLERYRFVALALAFVLTSITVYINLSGIKITFGTLFYFERMLLRSTVCWAWIFAILGFAKHFLNYTNVKLKYTSEAVLPFYMLHQTIIIIIGFFVLQWNQAIAVKYFIIALTSFLVIIFCYEYIIRRVNLLRFFFGMPPKKSR